MIAMSMKDTDYTGLKLGRLTVIKKVDERKGFSYWLCKCGCGKEKIVRSDKLAHKMTLSCGCLTKDTTSERRWKGGFTNIVDYLRGSQRGPVNKIKKNAGYKCQLTGKTSSQLEAHHLRSFREIIKEAHDKLNIELHDLVQDYTSQELRLLSQYIIDLHNNDNSIVVILDKKVHTLFHSLYGKRTTPENYVEFKERYLAGEFEEILNEG